MKRALILIDIQNDYFNGGSMECVGMEGAADNAARLLSKFRHERSPIFHIRHIAAHPDATFFLPGTKGAEINERVAPQADEPVITKHFPNSFRETSLLEQLRNLEIDELIICGAMTHMCIDASTRAAFDFGFNCIVAEDACAARSLKHNAEIVAATKVHAAFMAALAFFYASVISTNAILA